MPPASDVNGDPRCTAISIAKQTFDLSNSEKAAVEKSGEFGGLPDKIEGAARWLFLNRELVSGPLIPFLRCRFGIKTLDAIEASKRAHALEFPGATQ